MRMPSSFTDATMAPLRRQIEQSQRRGRSMPLGSVSASTTPPQWQRAVCTGWIRVSPTCLIIRVAPVVKGSVSGLRPTLAAGSEQLWLGVAKAAALLVGQQPGLALQAAAVAGKAAVFADDAVA